MYFDGASNALGHGVGAILVSPDGNHYPATAKLDFYCTNNIAEYEACILGLQIAIDQNVSQLNVFGDSALVIYQLRGEWETRDTKLVKYREHIMELLGDFTEVNF